MLTPRFIPVVPWVSMKFVEPREGMDDVTFALLISVTLRRGVLDPAAMETALILKGVVQGSRVMLVVTMVSTKVPDGVGIGTVFVHEIFVHSVFLVHSGKALMLRLAIILSKALQVVIDGC